MKKSFIVPVLLLILTFNTNVSFTKKIKDLKILHISLHNGCIQDFENVAHILGLNITSVHLHYAPRAEWDQYTPGASIYNIGHDRAKRIWDNKKDYFNQFDIVMTSDTTPLSRIFLQNGWKKPLIVWVCNRFDYYDGASNDCGFPDAEYYNLIRQSQNNPIVKFIPYTQFEDHYARNKGIIFNHETIKPLGWISSTQKSSSLIPSNIDKSITFFIPEYENNTTFIAVKKICTELQIPTYCGRYSSPEELSDFKGIIHMPNAWSNLLLFENMKSGLVHFVPSVKFVRQMLYHTPYYFTNRDFFLRDNIAYLSEWYDPEHEEIIVKFDSWDDLKHKIEATNFVQVKTKVALFWQKRNQKILAQWANLINELLPFCNGK